MPVMALEAAIVVLEISGAVAHRVAVFAENIGLADFALFEVIVDFLNGRIHPAIQVEIFAVDFLALRRERCALVMRQAGRIVMLRPCKRIVEILP